MKKSMFIVASMLCMAFYTFNTTNASTEVISHVITASASRNISGQVIKVLGNGGAYSKKSFSGTYDSDSGMLTVRSESYPVSLNKYEGGGREKYTYVANGIYFFN